MLNFLAGYRTYLSALAIIGHQGLKMVGLDIPQEQISIIIDTVLGGAVMYFRYKANK